MQPAPTTAETGGKTAARTSTSRTAALGGPVNAAFAMFWLVIAFTGWVLVLAGLSALQNRVNVTKSVDTYWNAINGARVGPGTIFRFDWWVWLFVLLVCIIGALAFASAVVGQARGTLVAWAAIAAVLSMISANNMLNVSSQQISTGHTSAARCAAAGFILAAMSFLALSYHVGLDPSKAPN